MMMVKGEQGNRAQFIQKKVFLNLIKNLKFVCLRDSQKYENFFFD